MIRLAEVIEELFEQCDTHFPINNSTVPLLILIKTIRYELNGEALSLKRMCAELNSSNLCTRNHIAKLERNGWLEVKTSGSDGRVKLIRGTPRIINTFNQLGRNLNPNFQTFINDERLK